MDIKAGQYKGRVVKQSDGAWAQYGESSGGNPEMILDLDLKLDEAGNKRRVSTPLYFSAAAAEYSFARLRACGWEGADVSNLEGVDKNEIDIEVRYEPWVNEQGVTEMKMKVQIMSGGGRFSTSNPVEPKAWAAKVAALTGTPAPGAATAPKPNF